MAATPLAAVKITTLEADGSLEYDSSNANTRLGLFCGRIQGYAAAWMSNPFQPNEFVASMLLAQIPKEL